MKNAKQNKRKTKRRRPFKGFLIAGASLAALFAIAWLKGQVPDSQDLNMKGISMTPESQEER